MCDQIENEPEVDYSTSVFIDNLEICDSSLLDSKLGDTCTVGQGDNHFFLIFFWLAS